MWSHGGGVTDKLSEESIWPCSLIHKENQQISAMATWKTVLGLHLEYSLEHSDDICILKWDYKEQCSLNTA